MIKYYILKNLKYSKLIEVIEDEVYSLLSKNAKFHMVIDVGYKTLKIYNIKEDKEVVNEKFEDETDLVIGINVASKLTDFREI